MVYNAQGDSLYCNPQTLSHDVCSFSPMPGFMHQSGMRIMILTSSIITSIPCIQQMTLEDCFWGWRNGSAVNRVGCSSRGPRFDSQDTPGSSQPSIAPVPGDLTTLAHLSEARMVPIHTCKQNSQINLKKNLSLALKPQLTREPPEGLLKHRLLCRISDLVGHIACAYVISALV